MFNFRLAMTWEESASTLFTSAASSFYVKLDSAFKS